MFRVWVIFTGRNSGALGVVYKIRDVVEVEEVEMNAIREKLYKKYEHVGQIYILQSERIS